jgi:hypothetical protein
MPSKLTLQGALSMFTRSLALSLALLTLLASLGMASDKTHASLAPTSCWERLLDWLPEDIETFIVAQGPFEIPRPTAEQLKFDEAIRFLPFGPVSGLQDGMLYEELAGQKVLCAIEGSRRFIAPRILGSMPYQGVHILQFDLAADGALRKAFRAYQEKAEKNIELAGERVAVFTKKLENDLWSFFVSQPQPGVLICATDQACLEETLKRIGRKPDRRALPADLPEWKHVDINARVWAIRHYRKESAEKDPSSPLGPKAGANVPDPDAVGLVFWYRPENDKLVRARYLSGARNALVLATEGWSHPTEFLTPVIKQAAPDVVEIAISVSDERTVPMFLLVLSGNLGHGHYL